MMIENSSRHTLVMKGIPNRASYKEVMENLRYVFERHGPVGLLRIIKNIDKKSRYFGTLKGFAFIQFVNSEDCKQAYTRECGVKFMDKVVQLEIAKEDRFIVNKPTVNSSKKQFPQLCEYDKYPQDVRALLIKKMPTNITHFYIAKTLRKIFEKYDDVLRIVRNKNDPTVSCVIFSCKERCCNAYYEVVENENTHDVFGNKLSTLVEFGNAYCV